MLVDELEEALGSPGRLCDALQEAIARALKSNVRDLRHAIGQITQVAGNIVRGSVTLRKDEATVARSIVLGVLQGVRGSSLDAFEAIRTASEAVVRHTGAMGGDVGSAARGVIDGATEGMEDVEGATYRAASAAILGALGAATELGPAAVQRVRPSILRSIAGIRAAAPAGKGTGR